MRSIGKLRITLVIIIWIAIYVIKGVGVVLQTSISLVLPIYPHTLDGIPTSNGIVEE